jgi:hypothetical protein
MAIRSCSPAQRPDAGFLFGKLALFIGVKRIFPIIYCTHCFRIKPQAASFVMQTEIMHKQLCLLFLCFYSSILFAQKTDSITIFYRSDGFTLSKNDHQSLDGFLSKGWDRILIRSYADVTDEDDYNIELSRNRAKEVNDYLLKKRFPSSSITTEYYGEKIQLADNATEEGRALNRRTTVIGVVYKKIPPKKTEDLTKPVTTTLQNGFIITYRPAYMPQELIDQFQSGQNFQVISNTTEMRNNNLYNNTTNGEILSSVTIFCGGQFNPCKIDSPVFVKVPIPDPKCDISSVKFFVAVERNGKQIWEEQQKQLFYQVINGQKYLGVWIDNFCGCINFDIKIGPGCFNIDSLALITSSGIRNVSSELEGLNSVYIPRQSSDSVYSIWYPDGDVSAAKVSFGLYNGKRIVRRFSNQSLTSFPLAEDGKSYILKPDTIRFQYKGIKDLALVFRVNRDVYRRIPENNTYEFLYMHRYPENITVDLYATGKRKKELVYKSVPLELIRFDNTAGVYKIDKELMTLLANKKKESEKKQKDPKGVSSR